jgi:phenylacetate-CoA ligase
VGLLPADRLFFPFSFGPFIGFWAAFEGACRLGNLSLSGGGMTTAARLRFLQENRATVVACTPTYALHMAEVAAAEGIDLRASPVRALVVAGEPGGSVPGTRRRIESAWGARCFDHCGMTEAGAFGFECVENPGGMHVLEEEFIVEVVDPETGRRLADGEAGELVITNLGRLGSPVIRYRCGDLVRWSEAPCPCGRAYGRFAGGILGRLDDMLIVRGNNVYPAAIEALLRGFEEVAEYRVRLRQAGEMATLEVEVESFPAASAEGGNSQAGKKLAGRVAAAIEERFLFRAAVRAVPPGTLPRFELKAKRFIRDASQGALDPGWSVE